MNTVKLFFVSLFLSAGLSSVATADEEPIGSQGELTPVAEEVPNAAEIASGERLNVEGKRFSLLPPQGWSIFRQELGVSLLLKAPKKEGDQVERTIQVGTFPGSRYIDSVTEKEFAEQLVSRFTATRKDLENYQVIQSQMITMGDGRPALLFYTQFHIGTLNLMQAHVLVSSETNHYLISYTDIAERFGTDRAASSELTEAWGTLTSVELDSAAPSRFEIPLQVGVVAGIICLVLISFGVYRHFAALKAYREYTLNDDLTTSDFRSSVRSTIQELRTSGVSKLGTHDSSTNYSAIEDEDLDDEEEETQKPRRRRGA